MCIDAMENWFQAGRLIHANTHVASDRSALAASFASTSA
jgi:hypothetical protein